MRKIKYATGKVNGGTLDKVTVVIDSLKIELMDKIVIEHTCHYKNKLKFAQTISTPAMSGKLIDDLGFLGTSESCQ